MLVSMLMNNYFGTILVFQKERPNFLREQANRMYGVTPYYMSKTMIEMPVLIIAPTLMVVLVYWTIGFEQGATAWVGFWLALILLA